MHGPLDERHQGVAQRQDRRLCGPKKKAREEAEGVTPDVMMTCEFCGHRLRVAKKR